MSQHYGQSSGRLTLLEDKFQKLADKVGIEESTPPLSGEPWLASSSLLEDRADASHDGMLSSKVLIAPPSKPFSSPPRSVNPNSHRILSHAQTPQEVRVFSAGGDTRPSLASKTQAPTEPNRPRERSLDRSSAVPTPRAASPNTRAVSPSTKESLFDKVDSNHDGFISRIEFDKALISNQITDGQRDMDDPMIRSPASPRMPGAVAKALESVVCHQIDSLGECLNICAQRSRTLKLLGFQHLNFDARLQSYLELKARSLGYLILDLIILVRSFLGMREVTRNACLWHKFKESRKRLCQEIHKNRKSKEKTLEQLNRYLLASSENLIKCLFDEWMRVVWAEKQQAAEDQKTQQIIEMQVRAMRSFMIMCGTDSSTTTRNFFYSWRSVIEQRQSRELKLQQTQVRIISWMSELRLEILGSWRMAVETERLFKASLQTQESMIQKRKILQRRGTEFALDVSQKHRGITLQRILIRSWKAIAERTRSSRVKKDKVLLSLAASDEQRIMAAVRKWDELTKKRRLHRSQTLARERYMMRSIASSDKASVQMVWESWVEVVRYQKKIRSNTSMCYRKILHMEGTLMVECFMSWYRVQTTEALAKSREKNKRYKESCTRNIMAMEQQFDASDKAACSEALMVWRQVVERKRAQLQRKESNKERALRSIAGDDIATTRLAFHEWHRCVDTAKREKHLAETKKHFEKAQQDKLALFAKHFNISCSALKECSFAGWKDLVEQKRRLQASLASTNRLILRMQRECLQTFFSAWQYEANTTVKTRFKERVKRFEEEALKRRKYVYQSLMRQVQETGIRCLGACFQAWTADVRRRQALKRYDAKNALLITSEVEALRSACFTEWMRDVQRDKHSKLLEDYGGLCQESNDMKLKVAQNMMLGLCDNLRQICFGEWSSWTSNMRSQNEKKETSVAHVLRQEAQGNAAIALTCCSHWHRATLVAKAEKLKKQMQGSVTAQINRQFASMCESAILESFTAWFTYVEDVRKEKAQKEQNRLRTARLIADPNQDLLSLFLTKWFDVAKTERACNQALNHSNNVKFLAGVSIRRLASRCVDHNAQMYMLKCFYDWLHYQRSESEERQMNNQSKECALLARTGVLFVLGACSIQLLGSFIIMSWDRITRVNKFIRRNVASLALSLRTAVKMQILRAWAQHAVSNRRLGESKRVVKRMYVSSADLMLVNCLVFWFGDVKYRRKGRNRKQIIKRNAERNIRIAEDLGVYCSLLSWKVATDCAGILKKSDGVLSGIKCAVRTNTLIRAATEVARTEEVRNGSLKCNFLRIWWHIVECAHYDKRFKEERICTKVQLSQMRFSALQHQVRCNGATWAGDPNPELLLIAWQMEAKKQLHNKGVRHVSHQLQANTLARTRMHAEQLGRRWERLELARCVALWRSVIHVQHERLDVASKHLRCQILGRAIIVKLQRRLYEQRFLYRWLWVCPPKPREIEYNPFSKDPPTFYVKPVSNFTSLGRDSHWSQAPQPPAIADRQHYQYQHGRPVSASLTKDSTAQTAIAVAPHQKDGVLEQLEKPDRLTLANRAMTSDYEYRKLFEQNRREIRDGPDRCHLCGRSRNDIPIYSCSNSRSRSCDRSHLSQEEVGVIGSVVAECVCQKMAQRLDLTSETAASNATVTQISNTVQRPQSAKPFSTTSARGRLPC